MLEVTAALIILRMLDSVFQLDCWFEGRVQGVGFRYQTVAIAKGYEVTGTVCNLPDGRVHLRAEGAEPEVRAFQDAVAGELEDYIRGIELKTGSGPRSFRGFSIAG